MLRGLLAWGALVALGAPLSACSSSNDAAGAAIATGVAVAATGVNRAITKDCWARCSRGYVCNQESGLCEPGDCNPPCEDGTACTITATGMTCASTHDVDPFVGPDRPDQFAPREAQSSPSVGERPAGSAQNEAGQVQIPKGDPGAPEESQGAQGDQRRARSDEHLRLAGGEILGQLDELDKKWEKRGKYVAVATDNDQILRTGDSAALSSYLERIRSRLHAVFVDGFLERLNDRSEAHALNNKSLATEVEIVLDGDSGVLVGVGITRTSGMAGFDVAVLEAVTRAGRFPPAPKDLRSADGNVYIHWELKREPSEACSVRFAQLHLPEVPNN